MTIAIQSSPAMTFYIEDRHPCAWDGEGRLFSVDGVRWHDEAPVDLDYQDWQLDLIYREQGGLP